MTGECNPVLVGLGFDSMVHRLPLLVYGIAKKLAGCLDKD